jgi:hypothetical protein
MDLTYNGNSLLAFSRFNALLIVQFRSAFTIVQRKQLPFYVGKDKTQILEAAC